MSFSPFSAALQRQVESIRKANPGDASAVSAVLVPRYVEAIERARAAGQGRITPELRRAFGADVDRYILGELLRKLVLWAGSQVPLDRARAIADEREALGHRNLEQQLVHAQAMAGLSVRYAALRERAAEQLDAVEALLRGSEMDPRLAEMTRRIADARSWVRDGHMRPRPKEQRNSTVSAEPDANYSYLASIHRTEVRTLAAATRRWRARQTDSERSEHDHSLEEALEQCVAALLEEHRGEQRIAPWPYRGRWYDGLILESARVVDPGRIELAGFIWAVETQKKHPIEATLRFHGDLLAAFHIRIAERLHPDHGPLWHSEFFGGLGE